MVLFLVILRNFIIPLTLSYFIFKLIYRKVFKSQKKISKFLVFLGWIGLIIFFHTPYSYYLEPSYWQFREICKLDPEIYQANGGKIDEEEYYNKVLKYFDTSLDKLDWEYIQENLEINDIGKHLYKFRNYYSDRIYFSSAIFFKDKTATKDNIEKVRFYAHWDNLRPLPAGNEGTGFYLSGSIVGCLRTLSLNEYIKVEEWRENNAK